MQTTTILKVLNCLIDTAQRTTDLEGVYNDSERVNGEFASWDEVEEVRAHITKQLEDPCGETIVIWNPDLISGLASNKELCGLNIEEYAGVARYEQLTNASVSSELCIAANSSVRDALEAIHNETNIDLRWISKKEALAQRAEQVVVSDQKKEIESI